MTYRQLLGIVLLIAIAVLAVQPRPAEAIEPTTVLLIVGGAIIIIAVIAVVVIANVTERQRRTASTAAIEPSAAVASTAPALDARSAESP
jgi:hypothetical protein